MAHMIGRLYNICHNDVIYCALPLYHTSGGAIGVSFCLQLGATMVISKKFSASRCIEECGKYNATVSNNINISLISLRSCYIIFIVILKIYHEPHQSSVILKHCTNVIIIILCNTTTIPSLPSLVYYRHRSLLILKDSILMLLLKVVQYIGEMCRYLLTQPNRPTDTQHNIRLAIGNGLREQIWRQFQSRFQIKQIGELYGSTEGNVGVMNVDSTVGSCGFVFAVFPSLHPARLIRTDPQTGEILRDTDGLAINCKPGQPGLFVGKVVEDGKHFFTCITVITDTYCIMLLLLLLLILVISNSC